MRNYGILSPKINGATVALHYMMLAIVRMISPILSPVSLVSYVKYFENSQRNVKLDSANSPSMLKSKV